MHKAAQSLLGEHDFSAFRAAGCQASNAVREVTRIHVIRDVGPLGAAGWPTFHRDALRSGAAPRAAVP